MNAKDELNQYRFKVKKAEEAREEYDKRRLILLGYTQKQAKHIAHYNKRKYGILTVEQLYHY